MDKQKVIEEMANEMYYCSEFNGYRDDAKRIAYKLVNAGYGNIEQALTEFAEKLKEKLFWMADTDGKSHKVLLEDNIDKALKEFLEQ